MSHDKLKDSVLHFGKALGDDWIWYCRFVLTTLLNDLVQLFFLLDLAVELSLQSDKVIRSFFTVLLQ